MSSTTYDGIIGPPLDSNWYVDSGATRHMTSDQHHLQDPTPYHDNDMVYVGNGESLPIHQIAVQYVPSKCSPGVIRNLGVLNRLVEHWFFMFSIPAVVHEVNERFGKSGMLT